MNKTLYLSINDAINESLRGIKFRHAITKHIYEIYGINPSISKSNEWYIDVFDISDKKNISFGFEHLRLLEEIYEEK